MSSIEKPSSFQYDLEGSSQPQVDEVNPGEYDLLKSLTEGINPNDVDGDALESIIDQHPEIVELVSGLKEARKIGGLSVDAEKMTVDQIRESRSRIGGQIMAFLGVENESNVNADSAQAEKRAQAERLRALGEVLSKITGDETDDELLALYGLIDAQGAMTRESMNSPLFKTDTKMAFDTYIRFVKDFEVLSQAEVTAGRRLKNTEKADVIRREAHDAVARLVERDLGLDFDRARRFVAKAREAIVPSSYEKTSYAQLLRGEKLASKFGGDAAAFTENSLRRIIESPMAHEQDKE